MGRKATAQTGRTTRTPWTTRQAGFTLMELLVVMAISVIILGLLFGPIIQGFNITRRTQAITEAQDAARFGVERLTRELSQASFVFDNSLTPIVLPMEDPTGNLPRATRYNFNYPTVPGGTGPDSTPPYLFTKLDFIPAGTVGPKQGQIIDPTTGGPVGGAELRFPLAPGRRVVRWFIGLRRNFRLSGNQALPAYYNNVYEFPRTDSGEYNPFILYRAEFDPSDPNLINPQNANSIVENEGGFNDPNFFYNYTQAPNGKTYAQNWRDIASPVLSSGNLDLLAWRRGDNGDFLPDSPFGTTVSFSPSTVVGDTATPGYLTDTGNESPSAVPSVYTAKYGQWVLPYTITVSRFTTRNRVNDPKSGFLKVRVERDDVNGGVKVTIPSGGASGSLSATQTTRPTADFTYSFSQRGSLFIKTRNLTYQVDPFRGRIITGFPPLAAQNGIPLFNTDPNSPALGEPIPTIFRLNTRNPLAGQPIPNGNGGIFPVNTGITQANLATPNYYLSYAVPGVGTPPPAGALAPGAMGNFASPFSQFAGIVPGGTGVNVPFGGATIVPGSERVIGPDNSSQRVAGLQNAGTLEDLLVPYFRIPALASFGRRDVLQGDSSNWIFQGDPTGPLSYKLEQDLSPLQPSIVFDETYVEKRPTQGLPVKPGAFASGSQDEREIQVTFLWQNNYARNADGQPVNADGDWVVDTNSRRRTVRPEADVVKVDYSTRSLLNIALGVRVYDSASGRPQLVQVSDKVKINNVGR